MRNYSKEDNQLLIDLIGKNIPDKEIRKITGFSVGKIATASRYYWDYKMRHKKYSYDINKEYSEKELKKIINPLFKYTLAHFIAEFDGNIYYFSTKILLLKDIYDVPVLKYILNIGIDTEGFTRRLCKIENAL